MNDNDALLHCLTLEVEQRLQWIENRLKTVSIIPQYTCGKGSSMSILIFAQIDNNKNWGDKNKVAVKLNNSWAELILYYHSDNILLQRRSSEGFGATKVWNIYSRFTFDYTIKDSVLVFLNLLVPLSKMPFDKFMDKVKYRKLLGKNFVSHWPED